LGNGFTLDSTFQAALYGYRYGEVPLPALGEVKDGTKITEGRPVELSNRPIVQASLGCHFLGAALPHCDPLDPETMKAGVVKRFASKPPTADRAMRRRLKLFVKRWVKEHLTPLAPDTDVSVEHWLENTNYPLWRKEQLRKKWEEFTALDDKSKKYRMCKSFMKDETYPDFKHARGINSRSDEFKCYVGPMFKAIEEEVYKLEEFIKHVPVADRPRVIYEKLYVHGATYLATDYTSFEALFTEQLMRDCEFILYEYMTQHHPEHLRFMRAVWETLGGTNVCEFKTFVVYLIATRMSGEMCTSLGNGFSNLMFMLFMCHEKGCTNVNGFIEGDDGIFRVLGTPPTPDDFAQLGLNIKLDIHSDLSAASFCGIIFDETDLINVTDPLEVLMTFGWTTRQYYGSRKSKLLTLLRCKGLSLAHQYPGCPVISALAQYALRISRSHDVRQVLNKDHHMSMWEREQLLDAIKDERKIKAVAPGMATRLLVENKFGLPVEVQMRLEAYLNSLDTLQPLEFPELEDYTKPSWVQYYRDYSVENIGKKELETPGIVFNKIAGHRRGW